MTPISVDEEYKKNKHVRPEDVKSLMEWTNKQPHLPKMTELESIYFLSCCTGSIEQAKSLTDTYFTSRTHCPEFFDNRSPEALSKDMEVVLYAPLKSANAFYTTFLDTDPSNFHLNEQIKLMWMVYDIWLLQNGSVQNGYDFIIDMKGVQFGHVTKLGIGTLKKALFILQEALPLKIARVHVINVIHLADKVLCIAKPFIKAELLDKIIFHTNGLDSLTKYVPTSSLPQNLNGTGLGLKDMHDNMKKMLIQNSSYFKDETNRRVDESKRPGKPKDSADLFGIEGSFKKLDID